MSKVVFQWDAAKNRENWLKHGVDFAIAQFAFADPQTGHRGRLGP